MPDFQNPAKKYQLKIQIKNNNFYTYNNSIDKKDG